MKNLLTIVLAGGEGRRLRPLTDRRAKPAVPFAGRRLIDFTLANCARSELGRVIVATQYRARSVETHVRETYSGRVRAFSATDAGREFLGTADAVRSVLEHNRRASRVLVLAGDHVYRMDYRRLLATHLLEQSDATLSVTPVARADARGLGIVEMDKGGRVEAFSEKPHDPPPSPLASMGIYVFERDALDGFLDANPDANDFGHDVIPAMLAGGYRLGAHYFTGEWRDIGDVDAYYDAHRPFMSGSWVSGSATVAADATVTDCILLDDATVGHRAALNRVIAEEGARIDADARIGFDPLKDAAHGYVTANRVTVVLAAPHRHRDVKTARSVGR